MKIRTKLILMYLLGATLTCVTSFFAIHSYRSIENDFEIVMNDPIKKIKAIKMIEQSGLRIVSSTSEICLLSAEEKADSRELPAKLKEVAQTPLEEEEEELKTVGQGHLFEGIESYRQLINESKDSDDNEILFLKGIELAGKDLLKTSAELIELKKTGVSGKQILDKKEIFEENEHQFLSAVEESIRHQDAKLARKKAEVSFTIQESSRNTIIVTTLAFIFAILSGWLIANSISNPINELQAATRRIGNGDLEMPILIDSKDEVGKLATDFRAMTAQVKISRDEILKGKDFVENLIGSMADMLLSVDDHGIIQRVNQATLNLLGYQGNELIGKPIKILTKTQVFLTNQEFSQMVEKGKLSEIEKIFVRKNGQTFKVSISCSILQGQSSTASVIVAKDISKRIEDEEKIRRYASKLEQSNRELENFAYVASHDLQEPLRKVQSFGDRLSRKYSEVLSDEGRDYVQRMRDSAHRMQNLINDLLTFSRVTSKGQPFQKVDLKQITKEVVSDLEVRIEQTKGTIEIGDLPEMEADPMQIRQLMQNLLGNALKFHLSGKPPIVKVYEVKTFNNKGGFSFTDKEFQACSSDAHFCQIVVEDNGIGFDEKYLDKIFTVFQRLHGRTEYEGSGIGLAVCRKIVERHGGTITAHSQPEKGAKFLISLPLFQANWEN